VHEPYAARLSQAVARRGALCVGIDPHPSLLRAWSLTADARGLERFARGVVEAVGDLAAVFKPQSAFFEAYGSAGIAVLERVLVDVRQAGALALLDVKRGDIGSTMAAYASAYLADGAPLVADAITLSPYLGFGALREAVDLAGGTGRGVYVLALTSNPDGPTIQRARTAEGVPVAQCVVDAAAAANSRSGLSHVGLVVAANQGPTGLDFSGFTGSILAPGLGAQGAVAADLAAAFGPAVRRVLPAMSRELLAAGPRLQDLRDAVGRAVGEMGNALALG
jgi:orotidine-5'-phosphate decarboxylase